MIKAALIVGLGSFLGGGLRYLSVAWIERQGGYGFPAGNPIGEYNGFVSDWVCNAWIRARFLWG